MYRNRQILCWLVLLAALSAGGFALSQQTDPQPTPADQAAAMKRWMDSCKPGKYHKMLDPFLGKWETKMTMMGMPPSSGKSECRWLVEGRWLMREGEGSLMGQPVHSFTIIGYDNFKQKYVTCQVDSFTTAMLCAEGCPNAEGKLFQSFGTMDEPMTGENDKMVRYVTRWQDADHYTFEVHDTDIGESNTKVVEFSYSRVKDGK